MKAHRKWAKIILSSVFIVMIFIGPASSETNITNVNRSYHVDFNNPQSQSEALNNIQEQVGNKNNNEELKIILFGHGRALSLDANALSNTKIKYGNASDLVQEKMSELNSKGVRFVICKTPTNRKRHYSTTQTNTTVEKEVQHFESQGYNCN